MTVNWTQEPARAQQPPHPHNALAWTLWILSAVVIITWVACMAFGVWLGGRIHLLLALFAALMLVHVVLGFRNVEYFVPLRLTGRWFLRWRVARDRQQVTGARLLNDPAVEKGEILPGNDPVSGPGRRKPDPMP